ncbi:MAG: hypothetical protein PHU59_02765 [Candidatus Omnitrophica bacterium]|jgi:hypothetical protein|nr:hypothetical protein [Candidatus Omnitrophota bacterium]
MRQLKKNKSGMLLLDLATTLTIIGFLIWVFGGIIGTLTINVKETALRYQLNNFRMLVGLYKQLKGNYPEDLLVLIQSSHSFSPTDELIFNEKFLNSLEQDEHGAPMDAFGNRLAYDQRKGVVGSTTKGYENW